jgi:hypothetical protein
MKNPSLHDILIFDKTSAISKSYGENGYYQKTSGATRSKTAAGQNLFVH